MNMRTLRSAMERGKKITVRIPPEALEHRKGTSMEKAVGVFKRDFNAYVRGKKDRKELVEGAAKAAKVSEQTASTYLHNFTAVVLGAMKSSSKKSRKAASA